MSPPQPVREFMLDNGAGMSLTAINRGGIVTSLRVPDRHGRSANVVLGLATPGDYTRPHPHLGTIVGRYANRIARGRFALAGQDVQLTLNDGANTLHGGPQGFGTRWWEITPLPAAADGSVALELRLASEDGDQGFPGRLAVRVQYTLTPRNEWRVDYEARCDRATVVNLSHHDYFNLAGGGSILGHLLTIAASRYCTVDAGLIPLELAGVDGTPFDFRRPRPIGERICEPHPQLLRARGYDHNWVLDEAAGLHFAARLEDPQTGRAMEILTTEPGLQFYSGNFLDGTLAGANGQAIRQGDGLCLETQHFPDSPNRPDFPSTVLHPGQLYASTTVHRFTCA
ncbi:aldose epimerase family protein [Caenimonas terrae]|uniref:Aldose 1-epimerase n=1 Tax=Caenimonas terrae TaxID=696074 RepID=A0ABW0NBH7_9BURK